MRDVRPTHRQPLFLVGKERLERLEGKGGPSHMWNEEIGEERVERRAVSRITPVCLKRSRPYSKGEHEEAKKKIIHKSRKSASPRGRGRYGGGKKKNLRWWGQPV